MAEEWISPSKKKEAGPSQLRVGQLRQQFETPQVQSRQQRAPPTRHNVPELRKKFERGSHRQSVPGSEQAHHDETEYVDILKSIVDHHKRDVSNLQIEITELEELVEDLSSDRLSSMRDPSESRTYAAQPSRKGTYNVESPTKAPYSGSPTRSADNSYDLDMRIHDLDVEDFYDSIYEDPWEHMPPRRYKEELEDDVFYHGGSPRGFRQQNPHNAAQYEMLSTGRHQSEVPDMQNYPGMSHRKRTRSQPTRKPEKEHAWPMRGSQKPFVNLFLPHESVYISEPAGKGTYNAGQSGKGTYTAGQFGKGTYTAEPSGKGTYTAGPSRKGTYAVGPSRKGTYTAQPARKGTYVAEPSRKGTYTAQPARKGTYTAEPARKGTYPAGPSRKGTYTASPNALQKTIMLRSPDRKDPQPINISVETRDISESASGEHVICDIDIELKEPKSRQRTPSGDTPKSVLRRNDPRRNLFDAERESPQYRSPKDNTIESETAPMDRTFEVSPDNSPMDKTFTPDRSPGGEDDGFQSQGNRTFSKSPPKLKLNDQTLHSSPDNRNDDTFEASPHDRSFLESPEHDSSFEASPHDRSFRESQGSSELDSSYEDSPASPRWKQRRSSQDEDETNGKQLDTTF